MKSWYSRVTDTVKKNDYMVYDLRDFLTRDGAAKIAAGTREIVEAAQRRAESDIDTQELDRQELKAAAMAQQQLEAFCAVLPFAEIV